MRGLKTPINVVDEIKAHPQMAVHLQKIHSGSSGQVSSAAQSTIYDFASKIIHQTYVAAGIELFGKDKDLKQRQLSDLNRQIQSLRSAVKGLFSGIESDVADFEHFVIDIAKACAKLSKEPPGIGYNVDKVSELTIFINQAY